MSDTRYSHDYMSEDANSRDWKARLRELREEAELLADDTLAKRRGAFRYDRELVQAHIREMEYV